MPDQKRSTTDWGDVADWYDQLVGESGSEYHREVVLPGVLRLLGLQPGQRAVVARGGSGGRGNKRFAGPTHQTPRFAERGLPGQETWLGLTLKLLADVGLIGLPNAGKSSLFGALICAASM